MSKGKALREHIGSIKSTQQITNAMKMAAAAKLKKAHKIVRSAQPYNQRLKLMIYRLLAGEEAYLPVMLRRPVKQCGLILITGNIGLAGSFSSGLIHFAEKEIQRRRMAGEEVELIAVGSKGYDYFKNSDVKLYKDCFQVEDIPLFSEAITVTDYVITAFLAERYDEVVIIYQAFHSAGQQSPALKPLLPVSFAVPKEQTHEDYIYEPDEPTVLALLVPQYLNSEMFQALLETKASEFAARVMAMSSATDNAEKMIDKLVISYNRSRQALITREITEIVNGANAIQ